jgi:chromosome segregation ATPase
LTGAGKRPGAAGDRSEALAAAAELQHRRREIGRRLDGLAEERRALEEIRDSLASEEQLLSRRIEQAERAREETRSRLGNAARAAVEMDGEAGELGREIAVLEQRHRASEARNRELGKEISRAERELDSARANLLEVTRTLESSRGALARMDRRLAARAKDK